MTLDLRSRILHLVERYPGLHLRDIQRRCGCSPMLAEYHLNVLERLGLVTSATHGRYRDFFPVRHADMALGSRDKRWLGLLRRPPILSLSLLLLEHGLLRPSQIAQHLALPPSTVSYQVRIAAGEGLVVLEAVQGGRSVRLQDPGRVLEILQAYHPTPDLITEYADLWRKVIRRSAVPERVAVEPLVVPAALTGLPPAALAVFEALRHGPMTQKQICRATGLARRTVYGALRRLEQLEAVVSHVDMQDTRQTQYWQSPRFREQDAPGPA